LKSHCNPESRRASLNQHISEMAMARMMRVTSATNSLLGSSCRTVATQRFAKHFEDVIASDKAGRKALLNTIISSPSDSPALMSNSDIQKLVWGVEYVGDSPWENATPSSFRSKSGQASSNARRSEAKVTPDSQDETPRVFAASDLRSEEAMQSL